MNANALHRYLLDANVIIAVLDAQHEHHAAALRWFLTLSDQEAATCPTVENALLRYLVRTQVSATDAHAILAALKSDRRTAFIEEKLSLSASSLRGVIGFRQITDVYLCQVATNASAQLATFDGGLHQLRPQHTILVPTAKGL